MLILCLLQTCWLHQWHCDTCWHPCNCRWWLGTSMATSSFLAKAARDTLRDHHLHIAQVIQRRSSSQHCLQGRYAKVFLVLQHLGSSLNVSLQTTFFDVCAPKGVLRSWSLDTLHTLVQRRLQMHALHFPSAVATTSGLFFLPRHASMAC